MAQNELEIIPDVFDEIHLNADISNSWEVFQMTSFMSNLADTTMTLGWKRTIAPDCPSEWEFYIADKNLEYLPTIDMSPLPFDLAVGETDAIFVLNVFPRSTAGCCEIDVTFYDFDSPNTIIDSIQYAILINDESCLTTSVSNLESYEDMLSISPNPVYSILNIQSEIAIDQIVLSTTLGVPLVKQASTNSIEVAHLSSGIYVLQAYSKGKLVGVKRIVKW